jgi:hypothetical protein
LQLTEEDSTMCSSPWLPASLLLCAPAALFGQGAASVKQTALARVTLAQQMAADPVILQAVAAKNAEGESQQAITARDREWTANPAFALRRTLTGNACARRLRELIAADALVVEAILMDERGANVCVSRETSDYFQGDEDKWKKPFVEGRPVFVDEPAFDQSSGTYAVQMSVPVAEGGKRIGALTLTLRVRKDSVAPGK